MKKQSKEVVQLSGNVKAILREAYKMKYMKIRSEIADILTDIQEKALQVEESNQQNTFIELAQEQIKECLHENGFSYTEDMLSKYMLERKVRPKNTMHGSAFTNNLYYFL